MLAAGQRQIHVPQPKGTRSDQGFIFKEAEIESINSSCLKMDNKLISKSTFMLIRSVSVSWMTLYGGGILSVM